MKRKVTAVIMVMLLSMGIMTLAGCGINDGVDDLSQTPNNADDNLNNDDRYDTDMYDGKNDGLKDNNDKNDNSLADDIRDGADDIRDGLDNALGGNDNAGKDNKDNKSDKTN